MKHQAPFHVHLFLPRLLYNYHAADVACLRLEKLEDLLRTRISEHCRAVTSNDANQPVVRHFNKGSHCVSNISISSLCPISCRNDNHKTHEMHVILKPGTAHPLGINEHFGQIYNAYLSCLTHSCINTLGFHLCVFHPILFSVFVLLLRIIL